MDGYVESGRVIIANSGCNQKELPVSENWILEPSSHFPQRGRKRERERECVCDKQTITSITECSHLNEEISCDTKYEQQRITKKEESKLEPCDQNGSDSI